MNTAELITTLESKNVKLRAENGKLKVTAPGAGLSPEIQEQLRTHKEEILKHLRQSAEKPVNPISLKIESIIKRGMVFNITPESFSLSGAISILTPDELEYLKQQKEPILCHLQQSFLSKIGFFRIKDNYDDFAQAIEETQAILDSSRNVAIMDVTRRYFSTFQHEGEFKI